MDERWRPPPARIDRQGENRVRRPARRAAASAGAGWRRRGLLRRIWASRHRRCLHRRGPRDRATAPQPCRSPRHPAPRALSRPSVRHHHSRGRHPLQARDPTCTAGRSRRIRNILCDLPRRLLNTLIRMLRSRLTRTAPDYGRSRRARLERAPRQRLGRAGVPASVRTVARRAAATRPAAAPPSRRSSSARAKTLPRCRSCSTARALRPASSTGASAPMSTRRSSPIATSPARICIRPTRQGSRRAGGRAAATPSSTTRSRPRTRPAPSSRRCRPTTAQKAKLDRLSFTSVSEMLAERFHMDEAYLKTLNPGADVRPAGHRHQGRQCRRRTQRRRLPASSPTRPQAGARL